MVKTDNGRGNDNGNEHMETGNNKGLAVDTWNIRSINDKEHELIHEFEQAEIDLLAITETKKERATRNRIGERAHDDTKRAQGGVGCIIKKTLTKYITRWDTVSERIMLVELNLRKGNKINVLILYGPNEDEKAETKEKFWDEVTTITESVKGDVIILGDLNGRVGRRDQRSGDVIGIHGEAIRNNNGSRIIDFCIENNMLVMNTFFRHKDAHKYTREVSSRNEKSIIDYAIVSRNMRYLIKDVRVRRGLEINSDHYLVLVKTRIRPNIEVDKKDRLQNKTREVIKSYKLNNQDIAERYREKVHELIEVSRNGDNCSLENMWNNFKHILLEAGRVTCGTIKINRGRKQTAWWNAEIKREVKAKKAKWQKYLAHKNADNYRGQNNQDNVLLVDENKISHPSGDAIEIEDVNTSIHKLKKGKAAGHDSITAEMEQLQVQSVLSRIENRQLGWFGHLIRMNNDRPVKKVWEAKRQIKRRKGRPPTTWDQGIARILESRGITRAEATTMAKNRKKWSTFVHGERQ
ncbi:hypothetical protein NQ318_012467 [Aromia moschata]|uniref:Endonuclease/exonuclease/phosphatase domain-containing protein n=1 Tax=Aromia moschata TaxID=1265417 RepID=A0AAV8X711_9CUCU|nr:hypothetical protein NQ318_012467 [Aromia moschata]